MAIFGIKTALSGDLQEIVNGDFSSYRTNYEVGPVAILGFSRRRIRIWALQGLIRLPEGANPAILKNWNYNVYLITPDSAAPHANQLTK